MPTLMHRTFLVTGLLAALAMAGCEQPAAFAPRDGSSTGYTDQRLGTNRWRVTFTGNAATSRDTVENYLMLRAAQVTVQSGYQWFVFDTRDTHANTSYHSDFSGPVWGPGFHHRFGWYDLGPDYVDSYPTTNYEAYAEIVMLTPEQAKQEPRAIDANDVLAHLTPPPPAPPAH